MVLAVEIASTLLWTRRGPATTRRAAREASRAPLPELPPAWYETSHTYGCKITPADTIYYCDNIEVGRHETMPLSRTRPLFFMINLATGGGWPVDLSRYDGRVDIYVDYVRVYSGAPVRP